MSQKLLPCPFCGSPALIRQCMSDEGRIYYDVICRGETCLTTMHDCATRQDAIQCWNTRSHQPLIDFYKRVCERAERNMEMTGTVSGAHWNAMRQEFAAMGIQVP